MAKARRSEAAEIISSYNLDVPKLNLGVPPEKVPKGQYWKLNGVDGRFLGGFRRFPGFKKLSYTVSTDGNTRDDSIDVTASTNFWLFKYVAVQKEDTEYVLRGWVVGIDGAASGNMDLVFLHYDTEDLKWYTYYIQRAIANTTKVDVASVGRNLMVAVRGQTPLSIRWASIRAVTVAGANDDEVAAGAAGRLENSDAGPGSSSNVTLQGTVGAGTGYLESGDAGAYKMRFRWYDPRRNLWSKLSSVLRSQALTTADQTLALTVNRPGAASQVKRGFTKLYVYRTIKGGGAYYLEQIVNFSEDPDDAGSGTTGNPEFDDRFLGVAALRDISPSSQNYWIYVGGRAKNAVSPFASIHRPTSGAGERAIWSAGMNDTALTLQRVFDPFLDEAGDPPKSGLITSYQEMAVMQGYGETDRPDTTGTIRWSTLFHPTAENFPESDHFYRPSNIGHTVLSLHDAGDYAFVRRDDAIVRLHRSSRLAINELYRKIGGVGRYGGATAGQFLYSTSPFGLIVVDGTSGRQDIVAAVERLFTDKELWGGDLENIHMEFDGFAGALFVLNKTTEEIFVLWFGNGAVTGIVDAPFEFVTQGTDPVSGGNGRVWLLGPGGNIYSVNWDRSADTQTMFGATAGDTVNGTVSSESTSGNTTTITMAESNVPYTDLDGFWVYFLSGVNRGIKRKVQSSSSTNFTVDALPYTAASGDRMSLGPIAMEVGMPAPTKKEEVDLFLRKGIQGGMTSLKMWGGELLQTANANLQLVYGVRDAKHTVVNEGEGEVNEEPGRTAGRLVFKGNAPLLQVRQLASNVDVELQGVQFYGSIESTGQDAEA